MSILLDNILLFEVKTARGATLEMDKQPNSFVSFCGYQLVEKSPVFAT